MHYGGKLTHAAAPVNLKRSQAATEGTCECARSVLVWAWAYVAATRDWQVGKGSLCAADRGSALAAKPCIILKNRRLEREGELPLRPQHFQQSVELLNLRVLDNHSPAPLAILHVHLQPQRPLQR